MTYQLSRAVDGRLTRGRQLFSRIFSRESQDSAMSDLALYGFDGFDGFSLKGYVHARARLPLTLALCLASENIRQIRQIRQLPTAVLRFAVAGLPSNRRQTAVKWGWSCCRA